MQLIGRSKLAVPAVTQMRGFTLFEVMIALFVTSIGLLGIAKIQALAYASTSSASARSLVAIQAAGLAAAMHANRSYWANGAQPSPITITNTTITEATNTLNNTATTATYCDSGGTGAPCTPTNLAAFDLHTWSLALYNLMPNSNPVTTITCPVTIPISCTIVVSWNERAVAVNSQSASNTVQGAAVVSNDTFNPTYTLYVEP